MLFRINPAWPSWSSCMLLIPILLRYIHGTFQENSKKKSIFLSRNQETESNGSCWIPICIQQNVQRFRIREFVIVSNVKESLLEKWSAVCVRAHVVLHRQNIFHVKRANREFTYNPISREFHLKIFTWFSCENDILHVYIICVHTIQCTLPEAPNELGNKWSAYPQSIGKHYEVAMLSKEQYGCQTLVSVDFSLMLKGRHSHTYTPQL